jgi:hypothetical protein
MEVKEQHRKMRKEKTVTIDLLYQAVPVKNTDKGIESAQWRKPDPFRERAEVSGR